MFRPHADNNKAMDELFGVIDRTETSRPEAAFIVAGDFNSTNLRKVLPRDTTNTSAVPRVARTHSIMQKLKRDGPVTRTIQQWSDQSDSALRDCFISTTEWCVFKDTDINTYTDAVIGYIGKCIDDVVPRITVRTFPNQKPWVNGEVRAKLKARTDAYNSGDLEEYRKSRYALRRAISSAKRQYRDKVESHYKGSNTRSMWAGLKTLTDYKKKISSSAEVMSASLPDELNTFYARFESTSPAVEVQKAQEDHCPPVITKGRRVCRTLKRINTRKAPGPDGIPGRALKAQYRSTEDAIALTLHTALSHLDQRDTYVRMLFIDYSSAFNTIVPASALQARHQAQRPRAQQCNFLTSRPQAVRMGSTTSSTLTLNTGAPQGCVLSPLLYSLFTHDCVATHSSPTPSSNLLTTRPSSLA
ncbi:hypothetical protein L3Q82_006667 [Scortum barcoo]|uniref:Uncharacterized protein n=1 Tax=Scortum barcoo TaxID=214431 RepID=A0ACB8X054_9TELE|nr:hypothetical protein L3Q82_006667 [Scortum barcoo]